MAQTQRLFLYHRDRLDELGGALDLSYLLILAALIKGFHQIREGVEVAQDLFLIRRGNHRQALRAHGRGFLRDKLDARGIHDRQQLLRNRFGRGQKAGAHAGGGYNYSFDPHRGIVAIISHKVELTAHTFLSGYRYASTTICFMHQPPNPTSTTPSSPARLGDPATAKARLRERCKAARAAWGATDKARLLYDATNADLHAALRAYITSRATAPKVAAYDPIGFEPGGGNLVESIAEYCSEVWLPVSGKNGQLKWGKFSSRDTMRRGALGIAEPSGPYCDSQMLGQLDVIVVPALAISHAGYRLGKGAGYYDRALAGLPGGGDGPVTLGMVFDEELVEDVPFDSHDIPVQAVLTPSRLFTPVRGNR